MSGGGRGGGEWKGLDGKVLKSALFSLRLDLHAMTVSLCRAGHSSLCKHAACPALWHLLPRISC